MNKWPHQIDFTTLKLPLHWKERGLTEEQYFEQWCRRQGIVCDHGMVAQTDHSMSEAEDYMLRLREAKKVRKSKTKKKKTNIIYCRPHGEVNCWDCQRKEYLDELERKQERSDYHPAISVSVRSTDWKHPGDPDDESTDATDDAQPTQQPPLGTDHGA